MGYAISKRNCGIAVGLLALSGTIGIVFKAKSQSKSSTSHSIYASAIDSGVVALGNLCPGEAITHLSAPTSAGETRIAELRVKENDFIKKGDVVAVLDNVGRLRASLRNARAQVMLKQANLDRVLAGASRHDIQAQQAVVQRLESEVVKAGNDFKRYRVLHTGGIISDADWEAKRATLDEAGQQLDEARASLRKVGEVRSVDIDVARADVATAQAAVSEAETNLDQAFVRTPETGQVLLIHTWPGERIGDQGILEMGSTQQMYAVAEVYESDAPRIHIGQSASITSSSLPTTLHGLVERIGIEIGRQEVVNADPAANTDARVVRVRVRLDAESSGIAARFSNLQVTVSFVK